MAFKPECPHGTTRLCGAHNRLCAVTFSKHIFEAYLVAKNGARVDAGEGAGDALADSSDDSDEISGMDK
jgi:hypothetical protein